MIYPDVTLNDWLLEHPELEVRITECHACGGKLSSTIPFMTKDYYGLESTTCPCGDSRTGCRSMVTRTEEAHRSWTEIVEGIDEDWEYNEE